MQNLTTINSTLIGLCCIPPHDPEYDHVHSAWKKRYDLKLLIDVADADGHWHGEEQIVQELTNRNTISGGRLMGGSALLIAVLLDLRTTPQGLLDELELLQKRLFRVFRKRCSGVLAFAHAGCIGQEDALYTRKKTVLHTLVDAPFSRICLIAADSCDTDGAKAWDTVMLLGDMLRRSSNVLNAFTNRQRLGFLEHAEYQEAKRARLEQQMAHIRTRLGDRGESRIKKALNSQIDDITANIERRYVPLAECQPTHAMVSPKIGFAAQLMRLRNRYCYEVVEDSVRKALKDTGDKLCKDIRNVYAISADEAKQLFLSFSEDVALGFLLNEELVMQQLRLLEEVRPVPVLPPEKINSRADIQAYLTSCVESAIAEGKNAYVDSIRAAYADLTVNNVFLDELHRIKNNQFDLDEEFQKLPDLAAFCSQVVVRKKELDSPFTVSFSGNGQSQAVCVCELAREDLLSALKDAEDECKNDMTSTLFYQFTALRTQQYAEEVPISMLRIKFFDISNDPDIGTTKK